MNKRFTIIYAAIVAIIITIFLTVPNLDDFIIILLVSFLFILTSTFTYAGRRKP